MAIPSKLDALQGAIKEELIEKILTGESYQSVSQWLTKQTAINIPKRGIERFGKAIRDKFGELVTLDMPPKIIAKNRAHIEAIGVDQVKQELLNKLAERNGPLFAYLDETEGS